MNNIDDVNFLLAVIFGLLNIAQFTIMLIQISSERKNRNGFGTTLSTIWREGTAISSKASALSNCDLSDRIASISSIQTSASDILVAIEEFRRHHWNQKPINEKADS